jgi:hypothetical protein
MPKKMVGYDESALGGSHFYGLRVSVMQSSDGSPNESPLVHSEIYGDAGENEIILKVKAFCHT